jgi:hypothetical protein
MENYKMKWKKLGKIFNPEEHKLPNGCLSFAQSPQTIVFGDFVRIYFSTRKKDEEKNKFLSHIAFVDFDKDFNTIKNIASDTVIELGKLGCFDEHGIFPINPLRDGEKILAYTCGWSRRVSVSVETSVGLAISEDNGLTFNKVGEGPVLTSSLNEPMLVGDAFVKKYEGTYHMWYIFGTKWISSQNEDPARVYKIGYAKSNDGINWEKLGKQIISDKLNENECQALPSVIKYKDYFLMVFCYREAFDFRNNKNNGYRIGYAYSKDLINWERDDNLISFDDTDDSWDSEMKCYPHIFYCNDKVYLLYNGNQFGKYGFGLAQLIDK